MGHRREEIIFQPVGGLGVLTRFTLAFKQFDPIPFRLLTDLGLCAKTVVRLAELRGPFLDAALQFVVGALQVVFAGAQRRFCRDSLSDIDRVSDDVRHTLERFDPDVAARSKAWTTAS